MAKTYKNQWDFNIYKGNVKSIEYKKKKHKSWF